MRRNVGTKQAERFVSCNQADQVPEQIKNRQDNRCIFKKIKRVPQPFFRSDPACVGEQRKERNRIARYLFKTRSEIGREKRTNRAPAKP